MAATDSIVLLFVAGCLAFVGLSARAAGVLVGYALGNSRICRSYQQRRESSHPRCTHLPQMRLPCLAGDRNDRLLTTTGTIAPPVSPCAER